MNATRVSRDLVTRGLPIRLSYDGAVEGRSFPRDPVRYAAEQRLALLGELAGMVERWSHAGRPFGRQKHRLSVWAKTVLSE